MYKLRVNLDGRKPLTVDADTREVRRWESTYDKSWIGDEHEVSVTDITYLAYAAAVRKGKFAGSWEEFDAACSRVEEITDEAPKEEPTGKEPSDG